MRSGSRIWMRRATSAKGVSSVARVHRPQCEQLPERGAEAINIAPPINAAGSQHLLGAGIARRAEEFAGPRQAAFDLVGQFAEPQVHEHGPVPVVGDHDVAGLDVAMDHAGFVQSMVGVGHLPNQFGHLPQIAAVGRRGGNGGQSGCRRRLCRRAVLGCGRRAVIRAAGSDRLFRLACFGTGHAERFFPLRQIELARASRRW